MHDKTCLCKFATIKKTCLFFHILKKEKRLIKMMSPKKVDYPQSFCLKFMNTSLERIWNLRTNANVEYTR